MRQNFLRLVILLRIYTHIYLQNINSDKLIQIYA